MALFLTVLAVCLLIIGGMVAILMTARTPRYRTEPEHLLELFDQALESRVSETKWNAVIGYPIRHDDYLEGVRRRAQRLMDEHGRPRARGPWQAAAGRRGPCRPDRPACPSRGPHGASPRWKAGMSLHG